MLQPEINNNRHQPKSKLVGVVDKVWDAGNYYFRVVAFAEMFILKH